MATTQCKITVTEIDGRLSLRVEMPDGAEKTIAGAVTGRMAELANEIMNSVGTIEVKGRLQ